MNVTMASIFMLVTATSLNSPNLINNYINEIDYKQFKTELQNNNCNVLSSNTIQYSLGYVKGDNLNVREEPNTDSEILDVISFNKKIKYSNYDKNWLRIKYHNKIAYVYKKYISKKKLEYKDYSVPDYSGFKSWMDYHKITMNGSEQKILQENYAYSGKYGIRQINGRYCVAIGSYFTTEIGQYFDLILKNGEVIPCILADRKDDGDTDSDNIFTSKNGCATEFVIDNDALHYLASGNGDISDCCEEWNSPVKTIRIYKKNIFDK